MALPAAARLALAKLKQGPVSVVIDPSGDNREVFVRDGVDLTWMRGQENAEVDLVGVYDIFTAGDAAIFELNLPERSQTIMNVLFADMTSGTHNSYTYWGFGKTAGLSLRTNAKQFRFRPWQTRADDSEEITLWLCVPEGDATLSQKNTEPHTWTQSFRALPDLTKADGVLIGRIKTPSR